MTYRAARVAGTPLAPLIWRLTHLRLSPAYRLEDARPKARSRPVTKFAAPMPMPTLCVVPVMVAAMVATAAAAAMVPPLALPVSVVVVVVEARPTGGVAKVPKWDYVFLYLLIHLLLVAHKIYVLYVPM